MATPETGLVNVCLGWLRCQHIPAWRNNTGAYKTDSRFIRFGLKGSSDIFAVLPPSGRFLAIETKVSPRKPTMAQLAFLQEVNTAGGLGIVVYELQDLARAIAQEPSVCVYDEHGCKVKGSEE